MDIQRKSSNSALCPAPAQTLRSNDTLAKNNHVQNASSPSPPQRASPAESNGDSASERRRSSSSVDDGRMDLAVARRTTTSETSEMEGTPMQADQSRSRLSNAGSAESGEDDKMLVDTELSGVISHSEEEGDSTSTGQDLGRPLTRTSVSSSSDIDSHDSRTELEKTRHDVAVLRKELHECRSALAEAEATVEEERAQLSLARQEIMTYQHTLQSSQSALAVQHRVAKALREEASTLQNIVDMERQRADEQAAIAARLRQQLRHYQETPGSATGQNERRSSVRSPR